MMVSNNRELHSANWRDREEFREMKSERFSGHYTNVQWSES
jgi:hypothetical protein